MTENETLAQLAQTVADAWASRFEGMEQHPDIKDLGERRLKCYTAAILVQALQAKYPSMEEGRIIELMMDAAESAYPGERLFIGMFTTLKSRRLLLARISAVTSDRT